MMYSEFVEMSGCEIGQKNYTEIIEPMYLAVENMSKWDFINFITPSAKIMAKSYKQINRRQPIIKKMAVCDNSGHWMTPNGCYYHIKYVELVDVDIKSGRYIVKDIDDETYNELSRTNNMYLSTSYDFDYFQCIDTKHKPIRLKA